MSERFWILHQFRLAPPCFFLGARGAGETEEGHDAHCSFPLFLRGTAQRGEVVVRVYVSCPVALTLGLGWLGGQGCTGCRSGIGIGGSAAKEIAK